MKVKVFAGFTEESLTKQVNKFLEDSLIEVVDIKFSSSIFYLSAMVIYKNI